MTIHKPGRRVVALFSLLLLTVLTCSTPAFAAKCQDTPQAYEKAQYTVRRVRIAAPLGWLFGTVKSATDEILNDKEMPIKANTLFTKQAYDDGFIFVNNKFDPIRRARGSRFAARAAYPELENCDGVQLDVVYRVYSFAFSNYLVRTFELGGKDEEARAVPETDATSRLARFFVQPYAGYNRSRSTFGGASLSVEMQNGFVKELSLRASGSSSSSDVGFNASGSRERDRGSIRYTEWSFEYEREDTQGGAIDLKRATGRAQILAATREIGPGELVLRFGGAVEGGNRQTGERAVALPADALADSGHKALKLFFGGSMNVGHHDFKASYGAQLGNAGDGFKLDYVKQIFDSGANFRFLPWEHHYPVTLEGRFAAGTINKRGPLPAAERFFGGNNEQNFISGDTWTIQANPLIRSYPQNRFAYARVGDAFGGERFFSANLTLAATVWAYPLVPKEVMKYCAEPKLDSDETAPEKPEKGDTCLTFDEAVEIGLNMAESSIKGAYLSDKPKFREMTEEVKKLAEPLERLRAELASVRKMKDPAVQLALEKLYKRPKAAGLEPSGSFALAHKSIKKILGDIGEQKVNRADVRALAVGSKSKPNSSRIAVMAADLEALAQLLPPEQAARIRALAATFTQVGDRIKTKFEIETAPESTEEQDAAKQAKKDMAYPKRVIQALSHEANLYSVSPVAFFDASRLWRAPNQPGDLRRGAGVGGRFSLVSLDVTAGYAWNLHPRPGEGRGAFIFSLALSNLFR
jgi:hypothetical protein